MSSLESQSFKIECPSCNRRIDTSYSNVNITREIKCTCGATHKINSMAISNLRNAISEMEREQRNLEKAEEDIFRGGETITKRR